MFQGAFGVMHYVCTNVGYCMMHKSVNINVYFVEGGLKQVAKEAKYYTSMIKTSCQSMWNAFTYVSSMTREREERSKDLEYIYIFPLLNV